MVSILLLFFLVVFLFFFLVYQFVSGKFELRSIFSISNYFSFANIYLSYYLNSLWVIHRHVPWTLILLQVDESSTGISSHVKIQSSQIHNVLPSPRVCSSVVSLVMWEHVRKRRALHEQRKQGRKGVCSVHNSEGIYVTSDAAVSPSFDTTNFSQFTVRYNYRRGWIKSLLKQLNGDTVRVSWVWDSTFCFGSSKKSQHCSVGGLLFP